jgi:hypothetical protein
MAKGSSQQSQQGGGYTGQYSGSTGTQPYLREFGNGFNTLSAQQQKLGNAPTAQMNGKAPGFSGYAPSYGPMASNGFSQLTNYGLSQGLQNIRGATNAANANLASQLGQAGTGDNSALLAGLQRQGQTQAAGAMNSLIPQAFAQQREQDLQNAGIDLNRQQLNLGANQANNQGALNSYLAGVQGTGANNAANMASYLGSLSGVGQGQNLLNSLLPAGQLAAGNVSGGLTGFDTVGLGKSKSSFK